MPAQEMPDISAHNPRRRPHAGAGTLLTSTLARRAALAAVVASLGLAIGGCGSSSVSDAVPKSTPNVIPPSDTSAEAAAVQTTSTSTTATKTKSTPTESTASSEGSKEGGEKSASEESSSETSASGGSSPGEEKAAPKEEASKGGGEESAGSSPTGGASAP